MTQLFHILRGVVKFALGVFPILIFLLLQQQLHLRLGPEGGGSTLVFQSNRDGHIHYRTYPNANAPVVSRRTIIFGEPFSSGHPLTRRLCSITAHIPIKIFSSNGNDIIWRKLFHAFDGTFPSSPASFDSKGEMTSVDSEMRARRDIVATDASLNHLWALLKTRQQTCSLFFLSKCQLAQQRFAHIRCLSYAGAAAERQGHNLTHFECLNSPCISAVADHTDPRDGGVPSASEGVFKAPQDSCLIIAGGNTKVLSVHYLSTGTE